MALFIELLPFLMFLAAFAALLRGYPVAFTLAGVALGFALIGMAIGDRPLPLSSLLGLSISSL